MSLPHLAMLIAVGVPLAWAVYCAVAFEFAEMWLHVVGPGISALAALGLCHGFGPWTSVALAVPAAGFSFLEGSLWLGGAWFVTHAKLTRLERLGVAAIGLAMGLASMASLYLAFGQAP